MSESCQESTDASREVSTSATVHVVTPANTTFSLPVDLYESFFIVKTMLTERPDAAHYTNFDLVIDRSDADDVATKKKTVVDDDRLIVEYSSGKEPLRIFMRQQPYTPAAAEEHIRRMKEILESPPLMFSAMDVPETAGVSNVPKNTSSKDKEKVHPSSEKAVEESKEEEDDVEVDFSNMEAALKMPANKIIELSKRRLKVGKHLFSDEKVRLSFGLPETIRFSTVTPPGNMNILEGRPTCVKYIGLSAFNPPAPKRRMQGDLGYYEVLIVDDTRLFVTATPNGFFVNATRDAKSFNPAPAPQPCFGHTMLELLQKASPIFQENYVKLMNYSKEIMQKVSEASANSVDMMTALNCLAFSDLHIGLKAAAVLGHRVNEDFQTFPGSGGRFIAGAGGLEPNAALPWVVTSTEKGTSADEDRAIQDTVLSYIGGYGASSALTFRDWNDEFQNGRGISRTGQQSIARHRTLYRIQTEFVRAATNAVIAIGEGRLQPMPVTCSNDGPVFVHNNIFISPMGTEVDRSSKYQLFVKHQGATRKPDLSEGDLQKQVNFMYDPFQPHDISGCFDQRYELKSTKSIVQADVDGVSSICSCVVDLAGQRYFAQAIIGGVISSSNGSRLCAGSVDDGISLAAPEGHVAEAINELEKKLYLGKRTYYSRTALPHALQRANGIGIHGDDSVGYHQQSVIEGSDVAKPVVQLEELGELRKVEFSLPLGTKGMVGVDNRFYIMDAGSLQPRDAFYYDRKRTIQEQSQSSAELSSPNGDTTAEGNDSTAVGNDKSPSPDAVTSMESSCHCNGMYMALLRGELLESFDMYRENTARVLRQAILQRRRGLSDKAAANSTKDRQQPKDTSRGAGDSGIYAENERDAASNEQSQSSEGALSPEQEEKLRQKVLPMLRHGVDLDADIIVGVETENLPEEAKELPASERVLYRRLTKPLNLNVNAYTRYACLQPQEEREKDEHDLREVSRFLVGEVIPKAAKQLASNSGGAQGVLDGRSLTRFLHDRGINMRYLGRLASHVAQYEYVTKQVGSGCSEGALEIVECEIAARAIKHVVRRILTSNPCIQQAPAKFFSAVFNAVLGNVTKMDPQSVPEETSATNNGSALGATASRRRKHLSGNHSHSRGSDALSQLAGAGGASTLMSEGNGLDPVGVDTVLRAYNVTFSSIWEAIHEQVSKHFEYDLHIWRFGGFRRSQSSSTFGLGPLFHRAHKLPMLRRLCQMVGVQLRDAKIDFSSPCPLRPDDVIGLAPVVKHVIPESPALVTPSLDYIRVRMSHGPSASAIQLAADVQMTVINVVNGIHSDLAEAASLMGSGHAALGDLDTAVLMQYRAACIHTIVSGADSAEAVVARSHLARLYLAKKDYTSAARELQAVITLRYMLGGSHVAALLSDMLLLGIIYQTCGRVDMAIQIFEVCLRMANKHNPLQELAITKHLAAAYALYGNFDVAVKYARKIHEFCKRTFDAEDSITKQALEDVRTYTTLSVEVARSKQNEEDAKQEALQLSKEGSKSRRRRRKKKT